MKRLLSISVLMLPWLAHGQFILDPYRFLTTSDNLPPGIEFRWKASSLSSSPVSDWVDSVSGYHLTASGTAQPSWSTNGVQFDGTSDVLTATNLNSRTESGSGDSSPRAWLVIMKAAVTTPAQMVLGEAYGGGTILFLFGDTDAYFYENVIGSAALGPITTNTFDILACKSTNAVPYRCYTNGVIGWASALAWNGNVTVSRVGSGNGNARYSGLIKEIIVWSNAVFTASQIADIHTYSTNTYGFTP